jgi:hypothetical protein
MNPAKQKYFDYVAKEIFELAKLKHPDDVNLQRLYMIGFLRAQLAEAAYSDSRVFANFKQRVADAKKPVKTNPHYGQK